MFTLGQAAKEARVAKATISRAIASGRMSATRNDTNGYSIDPAELFRVFPRNRVNGGGNGAAERSATPAEPDETPALKAEIDGLRAQLATMRELADDMRGQRDAWQKQAEQAHRLLSDQRPQAPAAPPAAPARRGFFGWLKAS